MRIVLVILFALCIAPARPRLLVIGDSLTYGLAASSERATFKQLLATAIDADLGSQRTARLEEAERASLAWSPDIIVIEIGLNDVLSPTLNEADWPGRYGALLDRLQTTGAIVVAATPFRGVYRGHAQWAALDRYATYVREAAAARGVLIADLWAIECVPGCLSQRGEPSPFGPLYQGDGFHPNDLGHQQIAHTMLCALRPYTIYAPLL